MIQIFETGEDYSKGTGASIKHIYTVPLKGSVLSLCCQIVPTQWVSTLKAGLPNDSLHSGDV